MEGERWIKHYSNFHKILLVGEGDFSFSVCLAKAFCSATNMVATSLHNKGMVIRRHPTARANLETLENLRCTVLHEVDAHTMSTHPLLMMMKFDRIVFNFPHAGFHFREHNFFQIHLHQEVLRGFFRNARYLLTIMGEIHVTHKTTYPFSEWEVEKLGREAGLCLVEKVKFTKFDYPGYDNKRGDGGESNKTFPVRECSTFKFALLTIPDQIEGERWIKHYSNLHKSFCEGECSTFEFAFPNSHVCLHCLEEDQQMRRISQFMNQGRRSRGSRIRPKWKLFSALDM